MLQVEYAQQIVQLLNHPLSQAVLIIGFSEMGPVRQPVFVHGSEQAVALFGAGDLVDAYREAYAAGGRFLYLMRLSELATDDFAAAFEAVYPVLVDLPFQYLHPARQFFDSCTCLDRLFDLCQERAALGEETHFILGCSTPGADVSGWVESLLLAARHFPVVDETGTTVYRGYHFSVVPQVAVYQDAAGDYYTASVAATYAGMISAHHAGVDLTNKSTGLLSVAPVFPEEQLKLLSEAGYVVFTPTVRRGVAVYAAVTMTDTMSDYYRLLFYRVATDTVTRLRDVARDYLGLPASAAIGDLTFKEAVDALLRSRVAAGILRDYEFKVSYDLFKNRAFVELVLVPCGSLREIRVSTTVYVVLG
ncbi:MAG: hypothetical protein AB1330_01290 [Bacillota bacterium]